MFSQFLKNYFVYWSFYQLWSLNTERFGLFGHFFQWRQIVFHRISEISSQLQWSNLGMEFLGNINSLGGHQGRIYQNAGLTHLLAISGGQVHPICDLICFGFQWLFLMAFLPCSRMFPETWRTPALSQYVSGVQIFLRFLVSFGLNCLYGCTGALLRISLFSNFARLSFFGIFYRATPLQILGVSQGIFVNLVLLTVVSWGFGNLFLNYSFLLSALGATVSVLAGACLQRIVSFHKISAALGETVVTSFCMGLFFFPVFHLSLWNAVLANIVAVPFCTFVITPLSLATLIFYKNFPALSQIFIMFFDKSLAFFHQIAWTFQDLHPGKNHMFEARSRFYLCQLLLILWSCWDVYREKNWNKLKRCHRKIFKNQLLPEGMHPHIDQKS